MDPGERPSGGDIGCYHSIIGEAIFTGSGSGNKEINYNNKLGTLHDFPQQGEFIQQQDNSQISRHHVLLPLPYGLG
jgi:hypothetical protein